MSDAAKDKEIKHEKEQHACWLANAKALQNAYNELDAKHRKEVARLDFMLAQSAFIVKSDKGYQLWTQDVVLHHKCIYYYDVRTLIDACIECAPFKLEV